MDIENKLDEDRIEIIRKEPEVGDLVAYNRLWDGEQYTKEIGIVTKQNRLSLLANYPR
jgi:hypothetical protein